MAAWLGVLVAIVGLAVAGRLTESAAERPDDRAGCGVRP
jgi:hypothetical protein